MIQISPAKREFENVSQQAESIGAPAFLTTLSSRDCDMIIFSRTILNPSSAILEHAVKLLSPQQGPPCGYGIHKKARPRKLAIQHQSNDSEPHQRTVKATLTEIEQQSTKLSSVKMGSTDHQGMSHCNIEPKDAANTNMEEAATIGEFQKQEDDTTVVMTEIGLHLQKAMYRDASRHSPDPRLVDADAENAGAAETSSHGKSVKRDSRNQELSTGSQALARESAELPEPLPLRPAKKLKVGIDLRGKLGKHSKVAKATEADNVQSDICGQVKLQHTMDVKLPGKAGKSTERCSTVDVLQESLQVIQNCCKRIRSVHQIMSSYHRSMLIIPDIDPKHPQTMTSTFGSLKLL